MIGRCHYGTTTESLDGLEDLDIVSSYEDDLHPPDFRGLLIDMLNHGLAGDVDQRLTGQAGRTVSSWDNDGATRNDDCDNRFCPVANASGSYTL